MTDFPEIVSRLEQGNLTPDEISSYRSYCAGSLYRMYEEYALCLSFGAEWKTAKREERAEGEKPKSEAELERLYATTEPGKKETTLKYRIKGAEIINDTLTSLYYQTNKEMKMAGNDNGL